MKIKIVEITEMSQRVLDAFDSLVPQLSSTSPKPSWEEMEEIIKSKCSILLAAVDENDENGKIFGSMTLVVFRTPTGIRSWIEDVVVDQSARGQGIGEALVKAAVERAKKENAKSIDLTSRPSREAANRLYRRCGFVQRDTNIYRMGLDHD